MKVFCDFHHEDLYESLQLLFQKRMGWQLFRPIGMDWFKEGLWKLHGWPEPHPDTAKQYLDFYDAEPLGEKLWKCKKYIFWPDSFQTGIELALAKETQFDFFLATIPENVPLFTEFARQYSPKAKILFQSGNQWSPAPEVKNFLNSTAIPIPVGMHGVYYHQEFHQEWVKPDVRPMPNTMVSMQQIQPNPGRSRFFAIEKLLHGWKCKEYGAQNRDGAISIPREEFQKYADNAFFWHYKNMGEGYGFVIHKALATGRPVVCNYETLKNCAVGKILEPGWNCINVEGLSDEEVARQIQAAMPEHEKWAQAARSKFMEVVNFDAEFEAIKKFLENAR